MGRFASSDIAIDMSLSSEEYLDPRDTLLHSSSSRILPSRVFIILARSLTRGCLGMHPLFCEEQGVPV